jgi:hypothetical protein
VSRSRRRTYGVGICPDCGNSVERVPIDDADLDVDMVCIADDCDWSYIAGVCDEADYAVDGGRPEWELPEGHGNPPRAAPDIGFIAAAVWTAGGAFGVVLAALTSPVTAVLLVGAMVALAAGSLRLFREVSA